MIKLKISEKEKFKDDGQWFKDYLNTLVPFNVTGNEDYEQMQSCYEIVNNDLHSFKDKLKEFINPLAINIGDLEEELEPYPELRNKVNILKGEMLSRKETLNLLLLSSQAIKEKNEALLNALKLSIDEKVGIELAKQEMQLKEMDPKQIEEYTKQLRTQLEPEDIAQKDWKSETEIFFNKALRYCLFTQEVQDKKSQTFEDVVTVDRCFVYVGWKNGKPHIEIRNPLMVGFHKSPNERYIQNSDWIWYTKSITPAEALENYDLTQDQIERIGISVNRGLNKKHDVLGGAAEAVWDHTSHNMLLASNNRAYTDKTKGLNQSPSSTPNVTQLIWETHFEFKAFKEILFLSYRDEYNEQIVLPLSSDFKIPKSAVKEKFINRFDRETERWVWFDKLTQIEYTAEKIWIPRKYEIIRLGPDVYPVLREVPYQKINIEDPYNSFELSTKGAIFNSRNTKSVSLVQHAIAPYFQYLYVKKIQNRELSKYQGAIQSIDIDQIPDELGQDLYGDELRDKVATYLTFLKKTNKDFYSGSQATIGGLPPATRSPGSNGFMLGTAIELMNLQSLADLLKREISIAMGISPQREANFVLGSNVTDNQQAITQSYAITEPYYHSHGQVWKAALNEWLILFAQYCRTQFEVHKLKELSFHYWLPNNSEEILKVTPTSLTHTDIGLFLVNSSAAEKYAALMLQNSQAFAQNAGSGISSLSQIIKDITSGASPEEIHKAILIEEQRQHDRQVQLQQMQTQSQEGMHKAEIESREDNQKFEIEKITTKALEDRITKLEVAGIQATTLGMQSDNNNNNIPDSVDLAKIAIEGSKLELAEREFKQKAKVDEEKLKIDRIKANKPTSKK